MKSQNDVLTWHAGAQKDVGKPLIGFVGLDPNLAIFDGKMNEGLPFTSRQTTALDEEKLHSHQNPLASALRCDSLRILA